ARALGRLLRGACHRMDWAGPGVVFFFQAEDGIRDDLVTGVQTCALPIFIRISRKVLSRRDTNECSATLSHTMQGRKRASIARRRSEERRVGKEGRSWSGRRQEKEKRSGLEGPVGVRRADAAGTCVRVTRR